jgi:hypothetical protein
MYITNTALPARIYATAPGKYGYELFGQLWCFDRVYQDGIVPFAKRVNRLCWKFDANIVDGIFVDGWAFVVQALATICGAVDNWFVDKVVDAFGLVTRVFGVLTTLLQAGKIQYYVCVTFGVAAVVVLWLMLAFPK